MWGHNRISTPPLDPPLNTMQLIFDIALLIVGYMPSS